MAYLYLLITWIIGACLFITGQSVNTLLIYWGVVIALQLLFILFSVLADCFVESSGFSSSEESFYIVNEMLNERLLEKTLEASKAADKCIGEISVNGIVNEMSARIFANSLREVNACRLYCIEPIPKSVIRVIEDLNKLKWVIAEKTKKGDVYLGRYAAINNEPRKEDI